MRPFLPALLLLAACKAAPPLNHTPADVPCWAGQALGTHGRVAFFCEANRLSCVAQPSNTWSNLAYLGVGLALVAGFGGLGRAGRTAGRQADRGGTERLFAALVGGEALYLAVGSGLFHASVTRWAERLDLSGTYGLVFALLGFAAARLAGRPGAGPAAAGAVLAAQALVTAFKWNIEDFVLLPMVVAALVVALRELVRRGLAEAAAVRRASAWAAAAGLVWALDLSRLACAPDSPWQGHAAWHVLTALAALATFRAIRGAS